MSQSQRKHKSQNSTQKLSQTKKPEQNDEIQKISIEDLSNKCVRFFLTKMNSNTAIKKSDIIQNVFHEKPGKNFESVLDKADQTLKKVYGLDIDVINSDTTNNDMKSVITFLILTHIFMSKNESTDKDLWRFLKEFDIQSDTNIENVGNINHFITNTLIKQNYIVVKETGNEHENNEPKKLYQWGARAEEAVSKMDILKYVCKIYGTSDVKFWSEQYKEASEQFSENSII